jgi:hypothetical protein
MAQCKRHLNIETNLFCGKCGDPICPRCMVETPVGARCPSCARLKRVPTYRLSGKYYLQAAGAALGLAIATGLAWGFVRSLLFSGFFNLLIAAGVGFGIGEGISLAVNRKAGIGLSVIAGSAVILSYIISAFTFWWHPFFIFDIISVIIGIFVSFSRLR